MLSKYRKLFLILFVISCFFGLLAIKENNIYNTFLRIIRIVFLLLFYLASVKKHNVLFVLAILFFMVSSGFFSVKSAHLIGMLALGVSRAFLIRMTLLHMKKINKNLLFTSIGLFLFLGILILSFFYKPTLLFYLSALATLFLIVLSSLSFTILLSSKNNRGYLMIFAGIFLFVISDAVFGVQKINYTNATFVISATILYNIGYYLISIGMIEREKPKTVITQNQY